MTYHICYLKPVTFVLDVFAYDVRLTEYGTQTHSLLHAMTRLSKMRLLYVCNVHEHDAMHVTKMAFGQP